MGNFLTATKSAQNILRKICPLRAMIWDLPWSCVRVCSSVASVVSDSCNLKDYSLPGSSVHGILQGKNTGVGCHALLQGIFPPRGRICGISWVFCIAGRFFTIELPGKSIYTPHLPLYCVLYNFWDNSLGRVGTWLLLKQELDGKMGTWLVGTLCHWNTVNNMDICWIKNSAVHCVLIS